MTLEHVFVNIQNLTLRRYLAQLATELELAGNRPSTDSSGIMSRHLLMAGN